MQVALDHGAEVVEADLISVRGELVAGRDQPMSWLTNQILRGPTLAQVWDAAEPADVLKLDLKREDAAFLDDLVTFLAPRQGSREVMVATRDRDAIVRLHRDLPEITLLFSIGFPEGVQQLRSDAELQAAIGGVTIFQGLVEANLVGWLHERDLLVLAWPVNDVQRLNNLVRLSVDGVTTANLAILEVLA
jgi:glycerophosphoryl diester phosphodiesterase